MARKRATKTEAEQPSDQDAELVKAQGEIADYGEDGEVDDLIKAVKAETEELAKGGRQQPPADDDEGDDDGGDDDDSEEGEDDEEADEESDDDGDDDGDDDADMSDQAPPPPAKKKAAPPMKRSQAADAGERFLKSVLLDESGQPTAEAEVIEVSDVLVHMTDQMAKSLGELSETIGAMQLQLDQVVMLQKAMGNHQIETGKIVKSMQAAYDRRPATAPHPGVTHSMKKSMPGTAPKGEVALTKSQASAGLLAAFQLGKIGSEQYKRLGPMLDSQGVDAVMAQLPEPVAKDIKDAAVAIASK